MHMMQSIEEAERAAESELLMAADRYWSAREESEDSEDPEDSDEGMDGDMDAEPDPDRFAPDTIEERYE